VVFWGDSVGCEKDDPLSTEDRLVISGLGGEAGWL